MTMAHLPTPLARLDVALRRPDTLATVADRLRRLHGDRIMVTEADGGRELTFRAGAELVDRWSDAIAARISPGDRVVLAVPNGYDQLLLCLATSRAGGLPVPVNPQMRAAEIRHVTTDAAASLVVENLADLAGSAPRIDGATPRTDEVAALFYTSGTTGRPKGAALTHRALVGQVGPAALLPGFLAGGEVVAALPVAHIMGFVTYLGVAIAGIPLHTFGRFSAARVLDALETRRASGFVGVPSMYRMMLEAGAAERDLRSVHVWMSGADVMPAELVRTFKAFGSALTLPLVGPVGEAAFVEGYGMVEVGGGVAVKVSPPGLPVGMGESLGFRLPGYRFRVVGNSGRNVGVGQVGELWLKGPGVLQGYWNSPEATAAVLTPDGWLRTGDLVRRGPAGTVLFQGRAKNVIKCGGYSVYPREVEEVLEGHPRVTEAAVVGLPDDQLGEIPVAAVRILPGEPLDEAELLAWAEERLSRYKAPRRIKVVRTLPRTGTDKVQADRVRRLFR
jgi:long-chain acyl-CoA synthetase